MSNDRLPERVDLIHRRAEQMGNDAIAALNNAWDPTSHTYSFDPQQTADLLHSIAGGSASIIVTANGILRRLGVTD